MAELTLVLALYGHGLPVCRVTHPSNYHSIGGQPQPIDL